VADAAAGEQRQHRENGKPAARLSQQVFGSCPKRALHNGDFLTGQLTAIPGLRLPQQEIPRLRGSARVVYSDIVMKSRANDLGIWLTLKGLGLILLEMLLGAVAFFFGMTVAKLVGVALHFVLSIGGGSDPVLVLVSRAGEYVLLGLDCLITLFFVLKGIEKAHEVTLGTE